MLTQKELKKLLNYDPDTGLFTWKVILNLQIMYIDISGNSEIIPDPNSQVTNIGDVAGTLNTGGYISIQIGCRYYLAHRLAFLYMTGGIPKYPKYIIDHKDRIRHHNKWKNLRRLTQQSNTQNRNIDKRNKSGFTGIAKINNKWVARVTVNGKSIIIGYYIIKINAVIARCRFEINHPDIMHNEQSQSLIKLKEMGYKI